MTELPRHPRESLRRGHRHDDRQQRLHRRGLSRAAVITAALRVVDSDGVDAVTMRRVGAELGTGPASLYAHVEDKDELLAAVYDEVLGQVDIAMTPDPSRWQDQVKDLARVFRATLLEHRDLAKVMLGNIPTGPGALRGMEAMLAVLHAGKLPSKVVGFASDLIAQFVTVSAYEESLFRARANTPETMAAFQEDLRRFFDSLPVKEFPTVHLLSADLIDPDEPDDARFEFGLDLLVRGLAAHANR